MTEETENLVLEHLRAIRSDISQVKGDVQEIKARMTAVEGRLGIMQQSFDRHDERLARIETRVDLVGVVLFISVLPLYPLELDDGFPITMFEAKAMRSPNGPSKHVNRYQQTQYFSRYTLPIDGK